MNALQRLWSSIPFLIALGVLGLSNMDDQPGFILSIRWSLSD